MRRAPRCVDGGRSRGAGRALPLRHHADAHLRRAADSSLSAPLDVSPAPDPAHALRLRLTDFRNFRALDWSAPEGSLLLHGPNGCGKSSLVEAIYLAATTRSFRTSQLGACARTGTKRFGVLLDCGAKPRRTLELTWSAEEGRCRHLDGKTASLAEHLRVLPLLVWWQAESEVVSGAPEARRRFFDRAAVHLRPPHLAALTEFARALGEKRALLERGRSVELRSLADWNALLARSGAAVAAARRATVESVGAELAEIARAVDPSLPPITLAYRPSPRAAAEGETALAAELARVASAEIEQRRPVVGAHRDEIEIAWGGRAAREIASAGERKTIGLLLLAAQGRRLRAAGNEPMLLVDDADAELDAGRLERLFTAFSGLSRLVATTNRPELWGFARGLSPVAVSELSRGLSEEVWAGFRREPEVER